jgi:hypothetical protein
VERRERIGVDLDHPSIFQLLKTFFNAKRLGDVHVYQTGRGYHLKILRPLPRELNLHVRAALGDDPQRLQWDEEKLKLGAGELVDTLFNYKVKNGERTGEEYVNPLSLPFWTPRIVLKARKRHS